VRARANRVSGCGEKAGKFGVWKRESQSRHPSHRTARLELEQCANPFMTSAIIDTRHQARISQTTLTMENFELLWPRESSDIECLNGGVASGGCVCRYKGVEPGSRQLGGVQLVAAILVMYPWGCVKVLSAKRATLHSAFYTFVLR